MPIRYRVQDTFFLFQLKVKYNSKALSLLQVNHTPTYYSLYVYFLKVDIYMACAGSNFYAMNKAIKIWYILFIHIAHSASHKLHHTLRLCIIYFFHNSPHHHPIHTNKFFLLCLNNKLKCG